MTQATHTVTQCNTYIDMLCHTDMLKMVTASCCQVTTFAAAFAFAFASAFAWRWVLQLWSALVRFASTVPSLPSIYLQSLDALAYSAYSLLTSSLLLASSFLLVHLGPSKRLQMLVKYWHRELFNFSSDHLGSMRHVSLRFLCELCFSTPKNWHPAEFEFAFAASFGLGACQLCLPFGSTICPIGPIALSALSRTKKTSTCSPSRSAARATSRHPNTTLAPLCFTLSPPELPFPWPWAGPWVPASSAPPDRSNWI